MAKTSQCQLKFLEKSFNWYEIHHGVGGHQLLMEFPRFWEIRSPSNTSKKRLQAMLCSLWNDATWCLLAALITASIDPSPLTESVKARSVAEPDADTL